MTLLAVENLAVAYGGIQAVKGIDLDVDAGELVCLIGANGAGKSTTLKSICGLLALAGGDVRFEGRSLRGMPVHAIARAGISLVPEGRGIFGRMTVLENLQLGAYLRRDDVAADLARVYALFPRLAERRAQIAGTLSGGEQQMLAIGRALMNQPKLLLLDEPSMGLAPIIVRQIFDIVRRIATEGTTILLVEQNAALALEVSHRAYVLETGRVVLAGAAAALRRDARVRQAYLGEV